MKKAIVYLTVTITEEDFNKGVVRVLEEEPHERIWSSATWGGFLNGTLNADEVAKIISAYRGFDVEDKVEIHGK